MTDGDPRTLGQRQELLFRCVGHLIARIEAAGYHGRGGDWRAREGHMPGSLHYSGLAFDVNLFDAHGDFLTRSEDHRPFGEFWKGLDPLCRWGGDFEKPDGNHYSVTWQGRA